MVLESLSWLERLLLKRRGSGQTNGSSLQWLISILSQVNRAISAKNFWTCFINFSISKSVAIHLWPFSVWYEMNHFFFFACFSYCLSTQSFLHTKNLYTSINVLRKSPNNYWMVGIFFSWKKTPKIDHLIHKTVYII